MKKLHALILLLPFISCVEEDSTIQNTANTNSFLEATQNERWVISRFVEEGRDLTLNYLGSSFLFSEDKKITVENGTETTLGSWRIERDRNVSELYIDFANNRLMNELSEDWELLEFSPSLIRLTESDDTEIDTLIFVRAGTPVVNNNHANAQIAEGLVDKLQDKVFSIVKVTDDWQDYTQAMNEIELAFGKNRVLQLKQGNQVIATGIWLVGIGSDKVTLELDLADNILAEYVDEEWELLEIEGNDIRLEETDTDKDQLTIRQK